MTSPLLPPAPERGAALHRLVNPSARICAATIILLTGAGISAVFWKMPQSVELYDFCHAGIVDSNLAAIPLPSESMVDEMIMLPLLDVVPVADSGVEKYAQVYPAPASLAVANVEPGNTNPPTAETEPSVMPVVPQKFEPMRQIVEEQPIFVESVHRNFLQKPASVSTVEKSDELLKEFHFATNNRAEANDTETFEEPADPFSHASAPVSTSVLQPLSPLQLDGLLPLLPLPTDELQPLSALSVP